ncbi:MAG TPA: phosphoadenylyl-sulfate reductase [Bacteroidales bacterium]|nr:phosphoadenylyl-sulfate reductase [Bacteroidales bacterium]HCB63673.1 phosphoadenylyl-sulfate reductase [Bacteroidales bacterium]HCY24422.1 phosphoadenylyl-sulfate reductase [Bacteroidales bacterium]
MMTKTETIEKWNKETSGFTPEQIIDFAFRNIDGPLTMATSLSIEDQYLLYLIHKGGHNCSFFTLDTGRLPQETYDTISATEDFFGIKIQTFFPDPNEVEKLVNTHGVNCFYESFDLRKACCHIRKKYPMDRALAGKSAWFTGLRREQSVTRIGIPIFDLNETTGIIKISPLADMFENEVWSEIEKNNIPFNKLQKQGYRSLGCLPCTRPVSDDDDFRAGRWWWENPESKECGIHKK